MKISSNINLETCPYCEQNTFGMHRRDCPLFIDNEIIEASNAIYRVGEQNKDT